MEDLEFLLSDIAKANQIEVPLLKALIQVEAGNKSGFESDGRPQILFEGHIFYKYLVKKYGEKKTQELARKHPNIVYKKWSKSQYYGGIREHDRLSEAASIDRELALMSASYGMFQIMGFNHSLCGCVFLQDFINRMWRSQLDQIELAIEFLKNSKFRGKSLLYWLKTKHWANFAEGYNGPGYKSNKYDVKLYEAWKKFSKKA